MELHEEKALDWETEEPGRPPAGGNVYGLPGQSIDSSGHRLGTFKTVPKPPPPVSRLRICCELAGTAAYVAAFWTVLGLAVMEIAGWFFPSQP